MKKPYYLILFLLGCRVCYAQNFINPSFETWGSAGVCEINLAPDGWLGYSTAGQDPDEAKFSVCPTTIPSAASNGNVYARCVAYSSVGGEGMFQYVTGLTIGNNYRISFDYAGSNLYGGTGDISWHIFIDDTDVSQTPVFHSTDGFWTTHIYNFTATLTSHKIGIRLLLVTGAAGSGGIDNLSFAATEIPLQIAVVPIFANCFGVCNGNATVTATGGTPPYHYLWQPSGDTTVTTDSLCGGGSYHITVTDSVGNSVTDSVFLPVVDPFPVNITAGSTTICPGDTTAICAPSFFSSYNWSNGDTSDCISIPHSGNYSVTVTNGDNCTIASNQITITVFPVPADTIHASQTIFCASDSAQICSTTGFASYLWNTGKTTECIYTGLAGNYYVTVTDAHGCTAVSNHLALQVHPLPPVSISVNGDTLNAYGAVSYQWYLNGNAIGNGDSVYIAHQAGSYTVEVTDANGCHATSNAVLFTGLSQINSPDPQIKVYPNPNSTGLWQLEVDKNWFGSKLEVLDVDGRLVYKSEIATLYSGLHFEAASGVYLLKIYDREKNASVKLVKW